MRLGLAAWGLREKSLESQLKLTCSLGLDLLEFSIANYAKDVLQVGATKAQISEVKDAFRQHGVRLECGCTGDDLTCGSIPAEVAKLREVIDISAALGLRILRIFAGFSSDSAISSQRLEAILEAFRELHDYATERSVTLCVETHGGVSVQGNGSLLHFHSITTRIDTWKRILATGVSICYDPANLTAVGAVDAVRFYTLFKERIPYMHLKDFKDVDGGIVPAACGEGRLDWRAFAKATADFDGIAVMEYELPQDVEDGMRRSLSFLRQIGLSQG